MSERKDPRMRHGHRSKAENAHDAVPPGADLTWPEAPERWHHAARDWYLSLQVSAQVRDYQQSDVALAMILAEDLSRHLAYERQPIGGNAMNAFLTGCSALLATAGDRRRLRMELARPDTVHEGAHLAAVESIGARRKSDDAGA